MAIRPLPGELLEHLPRGIDQSQISHHVPLRGGPDGLLGETHLLLFHGELLVVTRASPKSAFRRLDLDPDGRAMLLAESWSVQLSLPTRGEATCFEVSSKQVATVLALISAAKPGQHELEDLAAEELAAEAAPVPVAETAPAAPAQVAQAPVQAEARPVVVDEAPAQADPAPAPSPTTLRDAFAASEAEHAAAVQAAQVQVQVQAEPSVARGVDDDLREDSRERSSEDYDDLNIDLDQEEIAKSGPLAHAASSVREIAASFRGAAASLRSAASSLRRSHEPADDEHDLDQQGQLDAAPDFAAHPSQAQEDSLSVDIDDVFAEVEMQDSPPAPQARVQAPAPSIAPPVIVEPTRAPRAAAATPASSPATPADRVAPATLSSSSSSSPTRTAAATPVSRRKKAEPARSGLRFNFDDLPTPTRTSRGVDTDIDANVSLAEFFDRHVPPSSDDTPSRRRRVVPESSALEGSIPESSAPTVHAAKKPKTTAKPVTSRKPAAQAVLTTEPIAEPVRSAPQAIVCTPVAPPPPVITTRAPATTAPPRLSKTQAPFATDPSGDAPIAAQVSTPTAARVSAAAAAQVAAPPVAPAPSRAHAAEEPPQDAPEADLFDPILNSPGGASAGHRANRQLVNPRWTKGARRSASAAASAATSAASATATAASAAVGRARVAANRLLDRRLTRKGRPRSNRRRQGSTGGRPTMAMAAALMTVAVLIYWALPSGDISTTPEDAALPQSAGLSAPLAEIASEIQASQASMVPAAIGSELPPEPEAEEDAATKAEAAVATDRDFYGAATLTPESPQPELLALKECRPLAERGLLVRVKVEIDEPTGTVPEVWVGDGSMDRQLRQCVSRQFKKATFVPKPRGKLIKQRLKLHF